ncbi:hypothetical protein GpartN1_g4943.t1 [Galdieria partita]|uniref:Uncharacterized protein n=1 Tax=Galdieria partita TaxID=83374 RepID=A0A9C7Q106_9RHOD|nr:hypothetical protein GpartN1_g4943.t1 [Galdieria partita]
MEAEHSLIGSAPILPLLPEQQYIANKGQQRKRRSKETNEKNTNTWRCSIPTIERDKEILEEEEVFNLLQAFRKYFPEPPSNLKAQQIIESVSGAVLTEQEEFALWKENLQPWSHRWYSKKDSFFKVARARFQNSSEIQFITKELAEEWAKRFFHSKEQIAD